MPSCDAIVIGGGTNGMAAAGRLAKARRRVVLLEAKRQIGGGAETREFLRGYRVSPVAHLLNVLDPRVEKELALVRHGLTYAATDIPSTALSANSNHLVLHSHQGETMTGSISDVDGAAWKDLRNRLMRFAGLLEPFKQMTPPRLAKGTSNDMMSLARLGLKIRGLGRDDLREFMRLMLINVADVLDDELGDDRLKGLIAHDAVLGTHLGPRSPNSLMLLYNRLAGTSLSLPSGGMGAVADAMQKAIGALGVEVRTEAEVADLVVEQDRVAGVALRTGETLTAKSIISAVNPRTTFLKLLGPRHLDTGFVRRVNNIRMRGNAAKLHLALSDTPDFRGADLRSRLVIAPSVRAVEDAFNPAKYGEFSERPVMEIIVPSAFEEGHAPKGHHVLSAIVQYAPHDLTMGWTKGKALFLKTVLSQLRAYAPGIEKLIVAQELLTPEDLARDYGFEGGNWHHGELSVEQMLFLRPVVGAAQYSTPIAGLFLAGAGSHPGGGISGAAGWNAAEHILKLGSRA
jgi:phytoene dehydrogenase-like protein